MRIFALAIVLGVFFQALDYAKAHQTHPSREDCSLIEEQSYDTDGDDDAMDQCTEENALGDWSPVCIES